MTPVDIVKRISRIDHDIALLTQRIAEKQVERDSVIAEAENQLRELRGQVPTKTRNVDGRRRTGPPKGTPNHLHRKFNEKQIREIRRRNAAGEGQSALAREFDVPQPTISAIVHRRTYKDVV